jgi:DNA-binding protein YbaB
MDRPNWNGMRAVIGDLRQALSEMGDVQSRLLRVSGVAWSDDRLIKVVVGPRGHLVELEIDPRVFRRPDSGALSAVIVQTARRAVEDVARQGREIIDGSVPSDLRRGPLTGRGIDALMFRHDADLWKEGDDGGG